jgi:hypothetical protein
MKPIDCILCYTHCMRIILTIILAATVFGAPCLAQTTPFISVFRDRPSNITLEARRVQSIRGDTMVYDLGKETITISADSPAARQFLKDVRAGSRSAYATVTLDPLRKNPLNKEFRAVSLLP